LQRFDVHKKWHQYPPRPIPEKPGILVEIDTVWDGASTDRLYIYTLIDVCSRWAFAWPYLNANTFKSIAFLERARKQAPFQFLTLQSDHGSEFATRFTERLLVRGMSHRHSRIRTPNDNAHLERFNRTIQDECLNRISRSLKSYQKEIAEYLHYYNNERPHMGLNMKTPIEVMRSY
jgi:transposase InsO family protein